MFSEGGVNGAPGVHVLVVDDDDSTKALLRVSLESSGNRVTVAADGMDGLREFFGKAPDLVLVDVQMPKMDGLPKAKVQ